MARAALGVVANLHFRPTTCETVSDTFLVDGPHVQPCTSCPHDSSTSYLPDRRHKRAQSALPAISSYSKEKPVGPRNCRRKCLRRLSTHAIKLSDCKSLRSPLIQSWSNAIPVFDDTEEESCSSRDSDWSDDKSYHSDDEGGERASSEKVRKGLGPPSSETGPTPAETRHTPKEKEQGPANGGSSKEHGTENVCSVAPANVKIVTARSRQQPGKTALKLPVRNLMFPHSDRRCTLSEPIHNVARQLLNERGAVAQISTLSRGRKSGLVPKQRNKCDTFGVWETSHAQQSDGPRAFSSSDTELAVPSSRPKGSSDSPKCPASGVDVTEDSSQFRSVAVSPVLLQQCSDEFKGRSTHARDQNQQHCQLAESVSVVPELSKQSKSTGEKKEVENPSVSETGSLLETVDASGACVNSSVDTQCQVSDADEQSGKCVDVDQQRDNVDISSLEDETTSRSNTNFHTQQCQVDAPNSTRASNISEHSNEYHFQDWPTTAQGRSEHVFQTGNSLSQFMQSKDVCCQGADPKSVGKEENKYACQQASQRLLENVENTENLTGSGSTRARTGDTSVHATQREQRFYSHDRFGEEDKIRSVEPGQELREVNGQQFSFASNLLSTCLRERATLQASYNTQTFERTQPVGRLKRRLLLSDRRQAIATEQAQLDEIPCDRRLGSPQLQQVEPKPAVAEHPLAASPGAGSFSGSTSGPPRVPTEATATQSRNGERWLSAQYKRTPLPFAPCRDRQRRFTFGMERLPPTLSHGFQYNSFPESHHQQGVAYGMATVPPHLRTEVLTASNIRQRRLTCGFERLPSTYPGHLLNDSVPKSNRQRRLSCGMDRTSPYLIPQFKSERTAEPNARQRRRSYGMERWPPHLLQRYQSENSGNVHLTRGPSFVAERQPQHDYPRQQNETFPPRRFSYGFESLSPRMMRLYRNNPMPDSRMLEEKNCRADFSHDIAWTSGEFSRSFLDREMQNNDARASYTQQPHGHPLQEQSARQACLWNGERSEDGGIEYQESWDDECPENVNCKPHQDIDCDQHFGYEEQSPQGWNGEDSPPDDDSAHQWELWTEEQDKFAGQKVMPPEFEHYSNAEPFSWNQECHLKYTEEWNDLHIRHAYGTENETKEGKRGCTTAWNKGRADGEYVSVPDEEAYENLAYENKWNQEPPPSEIAGKLHGEEAPTSIISSNFLPSPVEEARITHLSSVASGNRRPAPDVCHQSAARQRGAVHSARMCDPFYFNNSQAPRPLGQTQVIRASTYGNVYQESLHDRRQMPPPTKSSLGCNFEPPFSPARRCGSEPLSSSFTCQPSVESAARRAQSAVPETATTVKNRRKSYHTETDGIYTCKGYEGCRKQNGDWTEHGELDETLTKCYKPRPYPERKELRSERAAPRCEGTANLHCVVSKLGIVETRDKERVSQRRHSEGRLVGQKRHGDFELAGQGQHDESDFESQSQCRTGESEGQKQYSTGRPGSLAHDSTGEVERQKQRYKGELESQNPLGECELEKQEHCGEVELKIQTLCGKDKLQILTQHDQGELDNEKQSDESELKSKKQNGNGELGSQNHSTGDVERYKQHGEGKFKKDKQYEESELESKGNLESQMHHDESAQESPNQYDIGELESRTQYGEGKLGNQNWYGEDELESKNRYGEGELESQNRHGEGELEGQDRYEEDYLDSQNPYIKDEFDSQRFHGEGRLEIPKPHCEGKVKMICLVDRNGLPLDPKMVGVTPASDRRRRHSPAGARALWTIPKVAGKEGREEDDIESFQRKLQLMTIETSDREQDLPQVGHHSLPDRGDVAGAVSNDTMKGRALEAWDGRYLGGANIAPDRRAAPFVGGLNNPAVVGMATTPPPMSDPQNISTENTNSSNMSSVFYSHCRIACSRTPACVETPRPTTALSSASFERKPRVTAPFRVAQSFSTASHGQPHFRVDPDFPMIDSHLNGNRSPLPEIGRFCFDVAAGRRVENETLRSPEALTSGHYLNLSPQNRAAPYVQLVTGTPADVQSADLIAEAGESLPRRACFEPEGDIILK